MTGRIGRLHVITDVLLQRRWSHVDLARAAAAGGADVVQYRDKQPRPAAERLDVARKIVDALRNGTTRCVVNDDPALAREARAAGVHLGAEDPAPARVRRTWGEEPWIGVTANNLAQARRCCEEPIDYLGVGPVFGTRSKRGPAPALGLQELERIVSAVNKPVIAIGGIDASKVGDVLSTGAWGIAVLSAVVTREGPAAAVSEIRTAIDAWIGHEVNA